MKKPRSATICPDSINKIWYLFVMAVFFITVIFVCPAQAVNYWVSNAGNDGNVGTTPATAFKSLQKAANTATASGDVINVMDGTYSYLDSPALCDAARALCTVSGIPENYMSVVMLFYSGVTLKAQNRGMAKIIGSLDSFGGSVCTGIQIWGGVSPYNQGDNITIDGFEIDGRDGGGVKRIHDGICLNTNAVSNTIQYNKVHDCVYNGITIGKTVGGGGDGDAHGYCNSNTVRWNVCYSNSGTGIYEYASTLNSIAYNLCYNQTGNPGSGIHSYAVCFPPSQTNIMWNICYGNRNGFMSSYKNNTPGRIDLYQQYNIFSNNNYGVYGHVSFLMVAGGNLITNNSIAGTVSDTGGWNLAETKVSSTGNDYFGNTTNYLGGIFFNGVADEFNDPLYASLGGLTFLTSFPFKTAYDVNRVATVWTDTSRYVDRLNSTGLPAGDLNFDWGAHWAYYVVDNLGGQIGYPDPPANLGQPVYVGGANSWTSFPACLIAQANLRDPVSPSTVERVRYEYDISYEKSYADGGNIVTSFVWNLWSPAGGSYPYTANWVSATLPAIAGCGEGQFHWRVRCQDNVRSPYNTSAWTYAKGVEGADLIAFGVDVTTPTYVNDLAGSTTLAASSVTLTWNDVNDSLPRYVPATPAPLGYKRVSEVANYCIYRSTFTYNAADWGGLFSNFRAAVIALNTNHQSKMIVEPRGVLAAGAAHRKVNPPGAGLPYVDGLVVGDELLSTQTYYYNVTSIDYAGNESIQGNEISITPGNPGGGGDLEYIYDTANDKPCYGVVLPTLNELLLEEAVGSSLSMATPNNQFMCISNDFSVRHYARIKKVPGLFTERVRFYYTVGTFSNTVNTNVDVGADNYFFVGIMYDNNLDGYKYYYADFPSDIHACGDSLWNNMKPYGMVGVRVSGCQADKDPALAANWINAYDDKSYTYYVRRAASCDINHPGEQDADVRGEAMKHDWSSVLALNPLIANQYFMPDGNVPVDQVRYLAATHLTDPSIGDGRPDIFYGEIPDLFLRFAYSDGDEWDADSYVLRWKCDNWATGVHALTNSRWTTIGASTFTVVDHSADNTFAASLPGPFYGHYGFLGVSHTLGHVDITDLRLTPESAKVDYYFAIKDGGGGSTRYSYGAVPHVTNNQGTAQADPYSYSVLQDDLSRPLATSHPLNGQISLWSNGGGTWSRGGTYTVRINIQDVRGSGNDIFGSGPYSNVIANRGNDSGVYGLNTTGFSAPVAGTQNSPLHNTRLYYRFANVAQPVDGNLYCTTANFITAIECGDAVNNFDGFVNMSGPGGNGNGLWQGSFTLGATTQFIYYRVYACNNDNEPQAFVATSSNTYAGWGVSATAAGHNDHGVIGNAVTGLPTTAANRDIDRDHGWIMPTRFGGTISGARFIRITSEADLNGEKKVVITDVSTEGDSVGNIISHEIRNAAP